MEEIIKPVIALAEKGVVITSKQLKQITDNREEIIKVSGDKTIYSKELKVGDTIKYPAMASTLKRIMKNGKDEFYKGETAEKMVAFLKFKRRNYFDGRFGKI